MARFTGSRFPDDIWGTSNDDLIEGLGGDDRLYGLGGDDWLLGGSGHDELDGGSGGDRMEGGTGDDLYIVDSTRDVVVEQAGEGIDVILTSLSAYALPANVEDLVALSAADFRGTGNALDNYLYGYSGNDILDGAAGNDVMFGEAGDDVYFVDDAGDEVVEEAGEGRDTIITSLAAMALAVNVEELIFDGSGSFTGTGNGRDNYIEGAAGNDRLDGRAGSDRLEGRGGDDFLDGGSGADRMTGGAGNDTYRIDNAGDAVFEGFGGGEDGVFSSVSYTLNAGAQVEVLGTTFADGTAPLNLTGNDYGNSIYGNAGANRLSGDGGTDYLVGLGGDDLLIGGGGSDVLRGGAGRDEFRFDTNLGPANVDRIADFSPADDTISLDDAVFTALPRGPLPPGAFRIGPAAADADDRIIYDSATGALFYDPDGNGAAAQVQFAVLDPGLPLTAGDFVVI